jgi:NADP-dependent 3-hydroxy acid dehydrogenase YdfG
MSKELSSQVALITGASSGIGRAVALRLASLGCKVAITARREERLEELAAQIAAEYPSTDLLALPCDLRDPRAIEHLFARIRESWGGVDLMINNAGLGRRSPLCSGSTEHWREMLEVNVLALCICTREAVQDMKARGDRGHVVHIASMASHRVPPNSGVYSASKYAVRSLTEGLRLELREAQSDIRVSAISPGFVETEFAEVYHGRPDAARETYGRFNVLQPEDIAEAVAYVLCAPAHVQVHDMLIRPTQQPS